MLDETFYFEDLLKKDEKFNLDMEVPEGLYTFFPDWRDPMPKNYGQLDEAVSYQKGELVEQWTIRFDRMTDAGPEQGIIKVLYSQQSPELIEFDVEMN